MEIAAVIISAILTIIALVLFLISLQSYRIYKNVRLPFVVIVFLFFLLKGVLLSLGLIYEPVAGLLSSYYFHIFDIAILLLLYFSALKR
ncbi:MAG: hypothetical protein V1726_05075 [Methanobacteriota archaeon]